MNFDQNYGTSNRNSVNSISSGMGYIQSVIGRNGANYESLNQYIKNSMSKKLNGTRIDLANSIINSDFKQPKDIYNVNKVIQIYAFIIKNYLQFLKEGKYVKIYE